MNYMVRRLLDLAILRIRRRVCNTWVVDVDWEFKRGGFAED